MTAAACPHCHSTLDLTPPGGWCPECERPVLLGRGDGHGLDVWCPHCRRDHHHGRHDPATGCRYDGTQRSVCDCPPGTGDGHRVAHCHSDRSPVPRHRLHRDRGTPVNRRQRRGQHNAAQRRHQQFVDKLHRLQTAANKDGKPWRLHGLTGACRDCSATAAFTGQPHSRIVIAEIYHDQHCPAAAGITPWQPHPID